MAYNPSEYSTDSATLGGNLPIFYTSGVLNYSNKTTSFTAVATDCMFTVDTTLGNVIITLPTAGIVVGKTYIIKKISVDTNTITLVPASGLIDGISNYVFSTQYESINVIWTGTSYCIV